MLNCSPQSSLPVPWPFWELRGCTAGDITLFKERAGVARSAQIIPAVKQNLIKVESFFFSLRLCHGVFLQSENYKLRTKRTHCCGKQGFCLYKRHFCVAKCLLGCAQSPSFCTVPMQAARFFKTLLFIYGRVSRQLRSAILMETSQAKRTASNGLNGKWGHDAGCSSFRTENIRHFRWFMVHYIQSMRIRWRWLCCFPCT